MSFFTAVKISDGATPTIFATTKAASIAAVATDTAIVVTLSPNQPQLTAGLNVNATLSAETVKVIGTVNQGTSPWVTSFSAPQHVIVDSGTITTVSAARVVGSAGAIFDAPVSGTAPANALYQGVRGATTNPTPVTDGQLVVPLADDTGKLVVVLNAPRDLVGRQTTAIVSTMTEKTIVTAIASTFADITGMQITNASATIPVTVTIKDSTSGTTVKVYDLAAGGGIVVTFNPPLNQTTVNTNWTATLSVATVTVDVNVDYVKNV
jgi:hypothetical protein